MKEDMDKHLADSHRAAYERSRHAGWNSNPDWPIAPFVLDHTNPDGSRIYIDNGSLVYKTQDEVFKEIEDELERFEKETTEKMKFLKDLKITRAKREWHPALIFGTIIIVLTAILAIFGGH